MEHFQHSASKTSGKLQSKAYSLGLVLIGLLIFGLGAFNYYRVRTLSFSKVPEEVKVTTQNIDIPAEIIIPSAQIDLKVDPGQIKDGVWLTSETKATFLSTSAAPGSGGNTVIYGHNKKVIFGNLPYLSIGQKIYIKTASGKIYTYEVYKKDFVGPDRVDLVSPTNREELTVYTCWGIFDSQRAVVKAKPI